MATMSAERPAFYRPPPGYRSKPRPQSCIWSPSTANTSQAWTPSSPISYSYDTCSLPRSPNVQSGSPASDAGLRAGDILVNVGDRSTTAPPMTHSLARDIINTAGNTLNVQAQRPSGAAGAAPGGTSTGTSPMSPSRSMTPTYQTGEPSSSHTPYRPGPVGPRGYIPNYGHNDYYEISSIRKPDSNSEKFLQEKAREQWAISKQTYRTLPLIEPRPKVRRDQPMGMSYMRLMDGPSWHDVPRTIVNPNPPKLQEVMNRFGQRVQDNNPGVVHLQYNSPMNMYSNDNVANVLQPRPQRPGSVPPQSSTSNIYSQRAPSTHLLKPQINVDITQSPTYQLLHEEEDGAASSSGHGSPYQHPHHHQHRQQSHSPIGHHHSHAYPTQTPYFNSLMNSLLPNPGV